MVFKLANSGQTEGQSLTLATLQVRQRWFSVYIFPLGLHFGLTGNQAVFPEV